MSKSFCGDLSGKNTNSLSLALQVVFLGVARVSKGLVDQVLSEARVLNNGTRLLSATTVQVGDRFLHGHVYAAAVELRERLVWAAQAPVYDESWDDQVEPEPVSARRNPNLVPRFWIHRDYDPAMPTEVCGLVSWREHRSSFGNKGHKENRRNSVEHREIRRLRRRHERNAFVA